MTADCRPLLSVLKEAALTGIDALKIDVEGAENKILVSFFNEAPPDLWPMLIIIEDTHYLWSVDLFSFLARKGYKTSTRTKLNAIMRR